MLLFPMKYQFKIYIYGHKTAAQTIHIFLKCIHQVLCATLYPLMKHRDAHISRETAHY